MTAALITCYKVKVPRPVPDTIRRINTHCNWDHKCCVGSIHEQHIQSPKPIQLASWAQDGKSTSAEETPEVTCLHTVGAMLSCPKECARKIKLACQTFGCLLKCPALSLETCDAECPIFYRQPLLYGSPAWAAKCFLQGAFRLSPQAFQLQVSLRKCLELLSYITVREVFCTRLSQNTIQTVTVSVHGWMLQHARDCLIILALCIGWG